MENNILSALIICIVILIAMIFRKKKLTKENLELKKNIDQLNLKKNELIIQLNALKITSENLKILQEQFDELENEYSKYKKIAEPLKKYQAIIDIKKELYDVTAEMEEIVAASYLEAEFIKKEARTEARGIKKKAETILENAYTIASKIEKESKIKAQGIAAEAWTIKQNAEQYEATVAAMKNIINGYGDDYLIPNHSLIDDLAEDYSHMKAGQQLKQTNTLIKSIIKNNEAANSDYSEPLRKQKAIEFVLDAFNGKVNTILSKVKHDNFGKLQQTLNDAFHIVNHNAAPFRNTHITQRYFDAIMEKLKISVTIHEIKKQDLLEQREIREAMREEEKARRDFEKAKKEAEREEKLLETARKEIEEKLSKAALEDKVKFEKELEQIKQQLLEAEAKGQRAMSMAQQTKRGHVYVISNVGSFGENVLKIGLTRRLEPLDRIKELGDASVPFSFDVHAMIHSEDAPTLEKKLHQAFDINRLNKVNYRKEFFSITLSEIRSKIEELGLKTHWTMKAEALEYQESKLIIEKKLQDNRSILN